jgi:hypothetical protein
MRLRFSSIPSGIHQSIGFAKGGIELARAEALTLRRFIAIGGGGHRHLFGTPESIAEDLIGWPRAVRRTGSTFTAITWSPLRST